jgi:CDP-diacylglycerol--glycerol-3-phosphate 3-phosphatidyltransferase
VNTIDRIALVCAAGLFVTIPVFILAARSRARDADVARRGRTILLGWWMRDWFMWTIGPIERRAIHAGIAPDAFSWLSALFGLGAGCASALGSLSLAGWLILLGGVTDNLDGRIARARGVASAHGAFLDSTLDRFSETFTFLGLIAFFRHAPVIVLTSAGAMAGSMLVSYARARGEAAGVSHTAGMMQRAERLVVLALGAMLDPLVSSLTGWSNGALLASAIAVIAVGAFATAIYRCITIAHALAGRPAAPLREIRRNSLQQ